MNELIEVLKEERQRQMDWVKGRHDAVNKWLAENSYDYSKSMPRNYIIPQPILEKAMKWYKVIFVLGIVIAMSIN